MSVLTCPTCNSNLYGGWSPMLLTNAEGEEVNVQIEVEWCVKFK